MKKIQIVLILYLFGHVVMANEVNIYTSRHYDSDDALYAEFTKETGIAVNIVSGKGSALLQRLKAEGVNSPADIFFTVDAGNLWKVQKEKLFQSIQSKKVLKDAIKKGGSTIRDFKNTLGGIVQFHKEFKVYGRDKKNCIIFF